MHQEVAEFFDEITRLTQAEFKGIPSDILAKYNQNYTLTEKQAQWLAKNAKMKRIEVPEVLQDSIDQTLGTKAPTPAPNTSTITLKLDVSNELLDVITRIEAILAELKV